MNLQQYPLLCVLPVLLREKGFTISATGRLRPGRREAGTSQKTCLCIYRISDHGIMDGNGRSLCSVKHVCALLDGRENTVAGAASLRFDLCGF